MGLGRANMAHTTQQRPDFGPFFQVNVLKVGSGLTPHPWSRAWGNRIEGASGVTVDGKDTKISFVDA